MTPWKLLGQKLQYARQRAGLTQAQVREHTSVGESSLSDFENGKREPSLAQLTSLAALYQRPASFFLDERPVPDREVVRWRQKPAEGAEGIEVRFLRLCEQYHNLETFCRARPTVELPDVRRPARPFGRSDAEALAVHLRRELALGDFPGTGLLRALEERCGLKVFHLAFEPTGTAACTKHPEFGPAVLLNAKNPRRRRGFDLAHELFHLLTWDFLQPEEPTSEVWTCSEEKLADAFAANLLMPVDAIREAVTASRQDGKLHLSALSEIARQFDVSIEALIWRVHALYGGTPSNKDRAEVLIQRARGSAELFLEADQEKPPERPARFMALAVTALQEGNLSAGRFAEYVGISRQRAMEYVEQEPADDEALELPAA